jgi:hypothetical protein
MVSTTPNKRYNAVSIDSVNVISGLALVVVDQAQHILADE